MSFVAVATRLILNFLGQPAVQGAIRELGRQAIYSATRSVIKAVGLGNASVESRKVR